MCITEDQLIGRNAYLGSSRFYSVRFYDFIVVEEVTEENEENLMKQ